MLNEAVKAIKIDACIMQDFSRELNYICTSMGVDKPFTQVNGGKETMLFTQLTLQMKDHFDEEEMAIKWCDFVDCRNIFPKLPVHLRMYRERWE